MDTDEVFELLSTPLAIEILKVIWFNHGIGFSELTNIFKISQTDLFRVMLQLKEYGLIFYSLKKYQLNALGRGIIEAINMIEDAMQGKDIVVFDISQPQRDRVVEYIDTIAQN